MKVAVKLLAILAIAFASCTGCRTTREMQRSTTDSTSYFRDQSRSYKDSLAWLDSVHTEMVQSWLDMGVVFAEECPPCDTGAIRRNDHHTGPSVDPRDYLPITRIETKPDGSTVFQSNQRLKALKLNVQTLASSNDSLRKGHQVKDSVIADLEKKVELARKEKTAHVQREWYIPWWIWLIVAGFAVLWIRKQFFFNQKI